MNTQPIGLFDSGVGGLTIMRELAAQLPNEHLIYLGDTARLPYGNKSPEAILRFAIDNSAFLLEQNIKLLIISCHTASSHAFHALKDSLPIPVLGVTEPGVQSLLRATRTKRVAVLGTAATIASGIYQSLIKLQDPNTQIFAISCPLFVPLVEEGLQDHQAAKLIAEHYLSSLRSQNIDAVLLACTHYPLLRATIQEVLGPSIQLVEPASSCAIQAKQLLTSLNLLNEVNRSPKYRFFASDDPEKFQHLAKIFFPHPIPHVFLRKLPL
jgi:glutamate racemase